MVAVGTVDNIVAKATVLNLRGGTRTVHNIPLTEDLCSISIDTVIDTSARVPFLVDDVCTVQAVSVSYVLPWPLHLLSPCTQV